ncbi:MAG: tyrosine protein kinase [Geobacteraceae bacterium GWC2_55_20]|nr:MAG: tyrosine protein kinase [Geobacteraceae bacterium GWC2_55_20]HCE67577.1 tyrosine protein kinase [Geobacter sp.]
MAVHRKLIAGLKNFMPGATARRTAPAVKLPDANGKTETADLAVSQPGREQPAMDAVMQVRPVDSEKTGWFSPSYKNARPVKLNPQVLAENRCVGYQSEAPELEFYRVLRTHILQQTGGKGNTVMVTSANPGEGKTLTAINLAFTFAREFKQTALLVDCDLRRQQIHERLGFPSDKGLFDYLIDDVPFSDLVVWPGVEKLTVISGGKTVKDSSELLGSLGMKNLVNDMKHRYPDRYVFFDVPPLLTSADSLAFAPLVDYVLIVVQAGKTSLQDVNKALKLIPGEKVLGLVMNRQQNLL